MLYLLSVVVVPSGDVENVLNGELGGRQVHHPLATLLFRHIKCRNSPITSQNLYKYYYKV